MLIIISFLNRRHFRELRSNPSISTQRSREGHSFALWVKRGGLSESIKFPIFTKSKSGLGVTPDSKWIITSINLTVDNIRSDLSST